MLTLRSLAFRGNLRLRNGDQTPREVGHALKRRLWWLRRAGSQNSTEAMVIGVAV